MKTKRTIRPGQRVLMLSARGNLTQTMAAQVVGMTVANWCRLETEGHAMLPTLLHDFNRKALAMFPEHVAEGEAPPKCGRTKRAIAPRQKKEVRALRGNLKQYEAAKVMRVDTSTWSNWELCHTGVSMNMFKFFSTNAIKMFPHYQRKI